MNDPLNILNINNQSTNLLTHLNLDFQNLPIYLLWISISGLLFILILVIMKILFIYKLIKGKSIFLEITPPSTANQSSYSTEKLLTTLHSLGSQIPLYQAILGKKKFYSLELVSSKNEGIRFLLQTKINDAPIIERNIAAYLPGVTIKKTTDYLPYNKEDLNQNTKIVEMHLSKNFISPLQKQSTLTEHDPIAYITNHMTKMGDRELISLQITLTPLLQKTHLKETKMIKTAQDYITNGLDIKPILNKTTNSIPVSIISKFLHFSINILAFCVLTPFTLLSSFLSDGKSEIFPLWLFSSPKRKNEKLSDTQLHLQKMVGEKINQELFQTSIRVFLVQKDKSSIQERRKGLLSTFSLFTNAGYQSLIAKKTIPGISRLKIFQSLSYFLLKNRLLSFSQKPILSVSELSSLFHLPYFPTTKTEDIVKQRSITLPAPLQLKQQKTKLDITFAKNHYCNKETPIGLTANERYRHLYILGATGTGKTTMLTTMINQDIQNGKGLCVVDPHGDLIKTTLSCIPKHRIKDVVFFNPLDRQYPFGLNILELKEGLTEEELEEEKDRISSALISIFHKIYSEKYLGPRMEHILRFTVLTALETENPTLFTLQKLLTDDRYRAGIVKTLKDPVVKDFWLHEFKKFGSYQQADVISPITNKLGRFLSVPLCRNILGQTHTTIDFENILENGKILLCNVPKGSLGEDNSTFFGALIAAKIQLAALLREKLPENKRHDFYLYIDEFQNFALPSFAQIMSEARKYGLYAVLAHQTIAQLDNTVTKVIQANAGTTICFRTSSPYDEENILPIFAPHVKKGDIANLPSFSFYIKINAITPLDTFSGEVQQYTLKLENTISEEIKTLSRKLYGIPKQKVVEDIKKVYIKEPKQKTKLATKKTKQTPNTGLVTGVMS